MPSPGGSLGRHRQACKLFAYRPTRACMTKKTSCGGRVNTPRRSWIDRPDCASLGPLTSFFTVFFFPGEQSFEQFDVDFRSVDASQYAMGSARETCQLSWHRPVLGCDVWSQRRPFAASDYGPVLTLGGWCSGWRCPTDRAKGARCETHRRPLACRRHPARRGCA